MGNVSSSGYGTSVPVLPTPDDYDRSSLRELYNSHVYSAKIKRRGLLGSVGSLKLHFGLYVTTTNGRSYLIHSTDAGGAQVITEARYMSSDWEDFNFIIVVSPKNNPTIGDLMASARKDGGYVLGKNNCMHTVGKIISDHFNYRFNLSLSLSNVYTKYEGYQF
ncbi:hypothetical protein Glove_120g122 [Diversispora epigaea]|uniref:Uncharacterized protein n=1 Tax=Diversispora epigaea TaxID=1348612 RepID=A0A397J662_9GLOM|nr:hypothetical protein Glove_120g122 [Diversispora epigaea]